VIHGSCIFFFHEICRAPTCLPWVGLQSIFQTFPCRNNDKGEFFRLQFNPLSPKRRHFGMIVRMVDIPGGIGCVHRSKKRAYRVPVGSSSRRREYEWEDMPGTGRSGGSVPTGMQLEFGDRLSLPAPEKIFPLRYDSNGGSPAGLPASEVNMRG